MSEKEEARIKAQALAAARGPKKRDPACLQLQADILIPKGTILRQEPGKPGKFRCPVAWGDFIIEGIDAHQHADFYKMVTSA
jgi:hypothetical protein